VVVVGVAVDTAVVVVGFEELLRQLTEWESD
jgi:hypothetical protein